MTLFSQIENKKILILGLGEEGLDNLKFIKKNIPYKKIGVADKKLLEEIDAKTKKELQGNIDVHLGKNYLSFLSKYDVIIKSPGVPMSLVSKRKNQIVTSQTDIFLSNTKGKVIGVTGTKGKSTTSLLLKNILEEGGLNCHLVGNIGNPVLSYLKKEKETDFYIYELSSFQLETTTSSPHIAIFLNVFVDHLDKHKNFEEYFLAKSKITLFQKEDDFFIFNKNDKNIKKIIKKTKAKKISFIPSKRQKGIATPIDPILEVVNILKIKKSIVKKVLSTFKGLPHRIEYVGRYKDIDFYEDSASTIPEATIHAIKELKKVDSIILGGSDKGINVSKMLKEVAMSDIRNIIIFDGSSPIIKEKLEKAKKNILSAGSMKEAVDHGFNYTKKKKICLLSPSFASFNMFKNYKERGDLFKKYIKDKK